MLGLFNSFPKGWRGVVGEVSQLGMEVEVEWGRWNIGEDEQLCLF